MKLFITDIETTSTAINTKIGSIGLVEIDSKTLDFTGKKFYVNIDLECPDNIIRHTSLDTMGFWNKQATETPKAFGAMFNTPATEVSLRDALKALTSFIKNECHCRKEDVRIFGNGPEFDCSILVNAYEQLGESIPWNFWNQHSVRTMTLLYELKYGTRITHQIPFEGTKHHAADDAKWEADVVLEVLRDYLKPSI